MKWIKFTAVIIAICFSSFSYCQDNDKNGDHPVTISGKVLNLKNEPVGGAVFYIDNVRTSNISKNDGTYRIKVNPVASFLEVRSSEFGTSAVAISGQTTINFRLEGGKQSSMKTDTIIEDTGKHHKAKKMNTYTNIYDMIRSEVPGVTVSGRSVQIQQAHSFFGSSTPLFVINGVIVQSIDNVNPVEVKSISLLKGSSAAIYGVNGSNGVISITLKNGTEKDK
jgi:TonB-dependent starch-binding outer membrane protein SusC